MDGCETALELLPSSLRSGVSAYISGGTEELRLRQGKPPSLICAGAERQLEGAPVEQRELMQVLEKATGASLHTASDAMAKGYYCYKGLRIGVCGEAAISKGQVSSFRSFSSLAIRIPHQCRGICDGVASQVLRGGAESVLIISPPGFGKTTALRELVRIAGDRGFRVSVIDERNELSASSGGKAAFDLGRCCDILVNVPKEQGAVMLLRSMNPQLIAMDEISRAEDAKAIETVIGCGVSILASAHGESREDMLKRPVYRELMDMGAFSWLVTIRLCAGKRSYDVERLKT